MSESLTVALERYRFSIRVVDRLVGVMHRMGLPLSQISTESIQSTAKRRTGMTNWGNDSFREPMDVLIRDINSSRITPLARLIARESLVTAAANRLRLVDYLDRKPETRNISIDRPIFILGFPRTGTTLLQNLMGLDPRRRPLEFWELTAPVPVDDSASVDRKKRIQRAEQLISLAYWMAPEMHAVHEVGSTTPEECWPLFANTFSVLNYDLQTAFANYGRWLLDRDMVQPYREYRNQLQVMVHERPTENLLLKCPEHLWFLDALLEVFPDACIVWTHRDPYDSIASYCSHISLAWRTWYGHFEPTEIGEHIADRFHTGIQRALSHRSRADPSHFFDVRFDQLVADPKAMVHQIAEHFDLNLKDNADADMDHWLENKRGDARGKHRYEGPRYGLDRAEIYERYAEYIEQYDIPIRSTDDPR